MNRPNIDNYKLTNYDQLYAYNVELEKHCDELEKELAASALPSDKCSWDRSALWHICTLTSCGHKIYNPPDSYVFCPFCGKTIKEIDTEGIMECKPSIMRSSKCPKCDNELIKCNEDELVCTMCYIYWIDGKWFRVCCDDFHNHTKKCLIEIDDVA